MRHQQWFFYGMLLRAAGLSADIGETGSLFSWERAQVDAGYKA